MMTYVYVYMRRIGRNVERCLSDRVYIAKS